MKSLNEITWYMYHQGMSLQAIGQEIYRIKPKRNEFQLLFAGVPMGKALTPEQCDKMSTFLRALVTYQREYAHRGKINVGKFIKKWREGIIHANDMCV